jgi:hypothetical protein
MIDWSITILLEANSNEETSGLFREAAAVYAKTGDPRALDVSEAVLRVFLRKYPQAPKPVARAAVQEALLVAVWQALIPVVFAVPGVERGLERIASEDEAREEMVRLSPRLGGLSMWFFEDDRTAKAAEQLADATYPKCSKLFETLAVSPHTRLGMKGQTPSIFFRSILEKLYTAVYRKTDFVRNAAPGLRRRN